MPGKRVQSKKKSGKIIVLQGKLKKIEEWGNHLLNSLS